MSAVCASGGAAPRVEAWLRHRRQRPPHRPVPVRGRAGAGRDLPLRVREGHRGSGSRLATGSHRVGVSHGRRTHRGRSGCDVLRAPTHRGDRRSRDAERLHALRMDSGDRRGTHDSSTMDRVLDLVDLHGRRVAGRGKHRTSARRGTRHRFVHDGPGSALASQAMTPRRGDTARTTQPNVNEYAWMPGSRNSISNVRSRTGPFCRMN
jgi:hypothetical protein